MAENNFTDPLDELIDRHQKVANGEPVDTEPPAEPEIDYGDNDLAEKIAEEDAARDAERQQRIEEAEAKRKEEESKKTAMPPQMYDAEEYKKEINFQTDTLSLVTTMVNKVVAKYRLIEGGIPGEADERLGVLGQRAVMGELMSLYYAYGDTITPAFEEMILKNWVLPDGSIAINKINEKGVVASSSDPVEEETTKEEPAGADKNETPKEEEPVAKININVEQGSPVTVNIDESIVANFNKNNIIDVQVNKVSNIEMEEIVVENSQDENIIVPYESGMNDVPLTLPYSAYRCVVTPINWFDFIRIVAPVSGNPSDSELKKWSVIHKHVKNVSIGPFKDFDDFISKTCFDDRELLMWGILVATADDDETLNMRCINQKCRKPISINYSPRSVLHFSEELLPDHYKKTAEVANGEEALKHWKKVADIHKTYRLPHSQYLVEVGNPTAKDYITKKLPLIQDLFKRYDEEGSFENMNTDDPRYAEFEYLMANVIGIDSISIEKNGKRYRYTHWDDIENIISNILDVEDSRVLLALINKLKTNDMKPFSFYISNVRCPHCGRVDAKIPITDIGETLLFQVSRRLQNTAVNLIETQ